MHMARSSKKIHFVGKSCQSGSLFYISVKLECMIENRQKFWFHANRTHQVGQTGGKITMEISVKQTEAGYRPMMRKGCNDEPKLFTNQINSTFCTLYNKNT